MWTKQTWTSFLILTFVISCYIDRNKMMWSDISDVTLIDILSKFFYTVTLTGIIYLLYIVHAKRYRVFWSDVRLDKDLLDEVCNYRRRSRIDPCKIRENVIGDLICGQRWFTICSDISPALTSQPRHEARAAKEPSVGRSPITAVIKELSKIARRGSEGGLQQRFMACHG